MNDGTKSSATARAVAAMDDEFVRFIRLFDLPAVRAFIDDAMPDGADLRHHRVLRAVEALGTPSVSELAERLDLDLSTVSRLVDKVIAAGLLRRDRDADDGRRRELSLTTAGWTQLEAGTKVRHELWAVLARDVDPAELEVLTRVFRQLREAAEQLPVD